MKFKTLTLLMSLFAVTPAFLGQAWGGYIRSNAAIDAEARECEFRGMKRVALGEDKKEVKGHGKQTPGGGVIVR